MSHIFISHVEEDADVALVIALGLEQEGYRTWCYEVDSIPGVSYLVQTGQAIQSSSAVVLIVSADSLGSKQVTSEVVRAHECGRPFIPVRRGITHVEFQARQPEWREAIGAATSIAIPTQGVADILPRIADGLGALGIRPRRRADAARVEKIRRKLDELSVSEKARPPVREAPGPAGTVGVTIRRELPTPTLVRNAFETAKRWLGRPVVWLPAVFTVVVGAVVVGIVVLVGVLSRGDGGGAGAVPTATTAVKTPSATATRTPVVTATPRLTTTPLATTSPGATVPTAVASPTATGAMAIITPREGRVSEVPTESLHLAHYSVTYGIGSDYLYEELHLVGGLRVPFEKIGSFEVVTDGDEVTLTISFLDGRTETGIADSYTRYSDLIGQTDLGEIRLDLEDVERVDFRWGVAVATAVASPTATGAMAIITPGEGRVSEVPTESLHLAHYSVTYGIGSDYLYEELHLVGGLRVPFEKIGSFEVVTDGDEVTLTISFLDGRTETGIADSYTRYSDLIGQTDLGEIRLDLEDVERVEFRW